MKRKIHIFIVGFLLCAMIPVQPAHSSDDELPVIFNEPPKTANEVITKINQDMVELYGTKPSYYPSFIKKDGANLYVRKDLIDNRLERAAKENAEKEPDVFTFEIVYGGDHGDELYQDGKKIMEYSGYNKNGESVSAEGVRWFAG